MLETRGQPKKMTEDVLRVLEGAFSNGATDREACFAAGISVQTLYNYIKEHQEYFDLKEGLKRSPVLKAKKTVVNGLDKEEMAKWYLERRSKKEFANRTEVTGDGGKPLILPSELLEKNQIKANDPHESPINHSEVD